MKSLLNSWFRRAQDRSRHITVDRFSEIAPIIFRLGKIDRIDRSVTTKPDQITVLPQVSECDCLFVVEENVKQHASSFLSHRLASRRAGHRLPETIFSKGRSLGECFVSKSCGEVSGGLGIWPF